MKQLLNLLKYLSSLFKSFQLNTTKDTNNNLLSLPTTVSTDEALARYLVGGRKNKNKLYSTKNNKVKPRVFMDERTPAELSVDRISTLTERESHELGKQFKKDHNPNQTYHGYGKIIAEKCLNAGANVESETYDDSKPYHANIKYPEDLKKEDIMDIANELVLSTTLCLYNEA